MTTHEPHQDVEGLCDRLERCARLGYAKAEQDTMREAISTIRRLSSEADGLRAFIQFTAEQARAEVARVVGGSPVTIGYPMSVAVSCAEALAQPKAEERS
jgi:hypothetical protein